ncbi:NUDIX domain-containing protein [Suttonella sp. R2A3]|uniref:NUDIX domain-containing protein n=1 Tax=Suttonella sp. R2A3 TaxID=2908648 RepID=UPI001F3F0ECE|nr:NUDIX domain-containing protein [Suttonella sp. R2A3]UJF24723.1 NUDIX domain-containing protein [Suttonella sp. R2A3]
MDYQFRVLEEKEVYRGFFKLRRYQIDFELFPGGLSGAVMRECSGSTGFVVAALPYDPQREEFVFVEQFRIGAMVAGHHPWQLEIVAGFMDKPGETPEECLQRELNEEIGTTAQSLTHVSTYFTSPGGSPAQTHFYFAEVDASQCATYTGLLEEGEDILVHRVPYRTAYRWLRDGQVKNATMMLALQAFLLQQEDRVAAAFSGIDNT